MAYPSSSIIVKVQLLDSSGTSIYVGNTSKAMYVWGAQLELAEFFEDVKYDLENFRYMRTRGVRSSHFDYRFGLDQTPDFVIPEERVFQSVRLTARSAGSFFNTQIERIDNTSGSAARTQELFIPETWYQLAPLYSSYINLFNNPNSTRDGVTVGELDYVKMDVIEDYNLLSDTEDYETDSGNEDFKYLPAL
jgi:hypothetical protein